MPKTQLQIVVTALDNASKVLTGVTKNFNKMGQDVSKVGRQMSLALTLPLVGLATVGIKAFADFDQAMNESLAIMNTTMEQEERMAKVAREVSMSLGIAHKEAAKSYFFLASAGFDAEQSIAALPAVAEFAKAGMFDMALATDLLTDAQSALGLTIKDDAVKNMENMIRVSDVLVQANMLANATVEQFSTALTTEAAAALKAFGIDMEEGVAVLAAFADQGRKGQLAGSSLSRIIRLMTKAANDNKKEMAELGVSVFNAKGEMRNMAEIIYDLEEGLKGMSDAEKVAALESIGFSARIQQVILPLIGTSAAIKEYEKGLRSSAGVTKNVAMKQMESFTEQMKVLKERMIDVGIVVGEILAPYIKAFSKRIVELSEKFKNLSPFMQGMILKFLAFVAILGPLLYVVGKFIILIGLMSKGFSKLPRLLENIGKGFKYAFSHPIILIITAIAIAVGVITTRLKKFGEEVGGIRIAWQLTLLQMYETVLDWSIKVIEVFNKVAKVIPGLNKVIAKSLVSLKRELNSVRIGMSALALEGINAAESTEELANASKLVNSELEKTDAELQKILDDLERLEEGSEDAADAMQKAFEDQVGAVKEIREEIMGLYNDLSEIEKKFKEDSLSEEEKYRDDVVKLIASSEKEIGKLMKAESDLTMKYEEDKLAAIEETKFRIRELEAEISGEKTELEQLRIRREIEEERQKVSDLTKIYNEEVLIIQTKIEKQESILESYARTELDLADKLAEHKEYLALNEMERLIVDHENKLLLIEVESLTEKVAIAERLLERKRELEVAMDYIGQEKNAAIAAEIEKTRTFREQLQIKTGELKIWVNDAIAEYERFARSISGGAIGGIVPVAGANYSKRSLQTGTKYVPATGTYLLHRGEAVTPAGRGGGGIVVNINGGVYLSQEVAEEIGDMMIDKLKTNFRF